VVYRRGKGAGAAYTRRRSDIPKGERHWSSIYKHREGYTGGGKTLEQHIQSEGEIYAAAAFAAVTTATAPATDTGVAPKRKGRAIPMKRKTRKQQLQEKGRIYQQGESH